MVKRKSYSNSFKAKIALWAIKETQTINELSSEYETVRRYGSSEPDQGMEEKTGGRSIGSIFKREQTTFRKRSRSFYQSPV